MLDVDFFKKVNDTYGHAIGDKVLKTCAKLMNRAVKNIKGGCVGRWGGEEFMILLPGYNPEKAYRFAEYHRQPGLHLLRQRGYAE